MDWFLIISILLVGIIFLLVEIYLLPGTTFMGILGGIIVIAGVYLTFKNHGNTAGLVTLLVTLGITTVVFIMGFKTITSKKFTIQNSIDGRANVLEEDIAQVGDRGKTITYLRPNGKALINGKKLEVFSIGDYIPVETWVEVVKVSSHRIEVKIVIS